ncbi:MAG: hypothetical protein AAF616_15220 [Bacteroidota bacterium]
MMLITKSRLLLTISIFLVAAFVSCDGLEEVKITYTEANAIYGDLEAIRNTPLNAAPRSISNAGKIFMTDQILLIGEESEGIHVYDNSDPSLPTPILFMQIPRNREFFISEDFIYAESVYDMLKIDFSDPQNPRINTRIPFAFGEELTNGQGETLIGFNYELVTREIDKEDDLFNYLSLNDNFAYYDFSQRLIPPSAVPASFSGSSGGQIGSINKIAVQDGHLYTVSRSQLSVYQTAPFTQLMRENVGSNLETVYPFNNRLFIGTNNSVEIFNVEDPAQPQYESSYWHATSCDPVLPVSEETAYATLRTGDFAACPGDINALIVLGLSHQRGDVREIQEIPMESPYGLTMIDNLLYVGEGENGLKIFDAASEQNLRLIKHDKNIKAYDVLPHPSRANYLLVAGPTGLVQYKLSDDQYLPLSTISF